MKFFPSRVLKWYSSLSWKYKTLAAVLFILLIVASVVWFLLSKVFSVKSIMSDSETTQVAVSRIEYEHERKEKEISNRLKRLEGKKKIEQAKQKSFEKKRKNELEKNKKEHAAIDGARDIDDVVNVYNKNRSKRKT